ncbi:hypothetical protein B6D60_01590 [candidate division KSB1 bacterium 4484_87]|nr:MAG: hypothetical protein B6D60_01590 [candidate division KSB1 bacterium 4484_87]
MLNSNLFAQKKFEGYWETETVTKTSTKFTGTQTEVEHEKIYYKAGKMKQVNLDDNTISIIRLDKGLTWTLNPEDKTYMEIRFEDVEKNMKAIRGEMAQKMNQLSDEEKEMMKKMMGDKFNSMFGSEEMPTVSFKVTGKKKTINGYKCKQVIFMLNNAPLMEIWMTNKYNFGYDMLKIYQKTGLIKGKIPNDKELQGFAIYTKIEMNMGLGSSLSESTVKKVVPMKISDKEFEIPAGYQKIAGPQPF